MSALRLFQAILEKGEHEAASQIARLTNLAKAEEIRATRVAAPSRRQGQGFSDCLSRPSRTPPRSFPSSLRLAKPSPLHSLSFTNPRLQQGLRHSFEAKHHSCCIHHHKWHSKAPSRQSICGAALIWQHSHELHVVEPLTSSVELVCSESVRHIQVW